MDFFKIWSICCGNVNSDALVWIRRELQLSVRTPGVRWRNLRKDTVHQGTADVDGLSHQLLQVQLCRSGAELLLQAAAPLPRSRCSPPTVLQGRSCWGRRVVVYEQLDLDFLKYCRESYCCWEAWWLDPTSDPWRRRRLPAAHRLHHLWRRNTSFSCPPQFCTRWVTPVCGGGNCTTLQNQEEVKKRDVLLNAPRSNSVLLDLTGLFTVVCLQLQL